MTQNVTQAYQQTPWRLQLQRFGLFLLGLVIIGLVAGLYLYITAETVSSWYRNPEDGMGKRKYTASNFKFEV
jgi:hypothetical protein